MEDLEIQNLTFFSELMLIDQVAGVRTKKKVKLYPEKHPWDMISLCCFLNELDNFHRASRRFFTIESDDQNTYHVFSFFHNIKDNYKITVRISNEIEVSATSAWLIDEWDLSSSFFFSYLRKGNRIRTKAEYQKHYYFKYYIPKLTAGTMAIIQNIPVLYT